MTRMTKKKPKSCMQERIKEKIENGVEVLDVLVEFMDVAVGDLLTLI